MNKKAENISWMRKQHSLFKAKLTLSTDNCETYIYRGFTYEYRRDPFSSNSKWYFVKRLTNSD